MKNFKTFGTLRRLFSRLFSMVRSRDGIAEPAPEASADEARSFRTLDSWWLDVKLGLRLLVKYPGLALVGGVGIAVAVAIAVAGFSIIHGNFLVSSLPLEEGDRIVAIETWDSAAREPEQRVLHDYQIWREELKSVDEVSAFRTLTPNLITPGAQTVSIRVASMSASGFKLARVAPLRGRYLIEADERDGASDVIVIGEKVWKNRFAGDPGILGRTIQLGATRHTVVGVMPEGFAFPVNYDFWVPLRLGSGRADPLTGPGLMVFGRLAPAATLATARAELAVIARRTAQEFPKVYEQLQPQILPYTHPFLGVHGTQDIDGLYAMQGLIMLLLVLVCLNVAILVYTRTAMRQTEISLRTALGASRGRIVTQLFIEAFVLSSVAALVGIGIAVLALRLVAASVAEIAAELPFWLSFGLSPEAVFYACGLSVLAAVIVGILPALQATTRGVQTGVRITGAGGSGMLLGKTWTVLIVAQVGFGVALLPPSLIGAWEGLQSGFADPGFAAGEFLSTEVGMDQAQVRNAGSAQAELMRRLEAEPRISGLTFAMANPGDEAGALVESDAMQHDVRFNRVAVNFFRTFDVPILAGRAFEPADVVATGARPPKQAEGGNIVVNQTLAQRMFNGDALGRRIRYVDRSVRATSGPKEPGPWYEIVGVVSDFPTGANPGSNDSQLKLYHAVSVEQVAPAVLLMRVRGEVASTFTGRLREIALSVDPDLQVRNPRSLDEVLRREQWIRRLEVAVLLSATITVLMLSSAGIYALMSFTVSQRRKEIAIRSALGADRKRIIISIFSRALGQLAVGAALGITLAALLERTSGDSLMRGQATVVIPAVACFMIAVGCLSALGPARRSLRIEPTEALREQ